MEPEETRTMTEALCSSTMRYHPHAKRKSPLPILITRGHQSLRSIPITRKLIHENCASKTQWLSTQGDFVPRGISGQCLGRWSQLGGTTPGIQLVEAKDTVKSPVMHRTATKGINSAEVAKLMKYGYFVRCCIPGI